MARAASPEVAQDTRKSARPAKSLPDTATLLRDYRIAWESRHASLIGRKEVLTGKAKFGIFGDGKEVPQLALAHAFRNGDFRSGYYRDQTFLFATGMCTLRQFFAQLYAHPDTDLEPASAGRQMNGHFASRLLDEKGAWRDQLAQPNSSADLSPTGGQMARLLGLAYASKLYRNEKALAAKEVAAGFSHKGNEVAWGTIGDASTSEGVFFETLNAAGVLQVPLVMTVWDDGYGISVPTAMQTTKGSISEILKGLQRENGSNGFDLRKVKAWDYPALLEAFAQAGETARREHVPQLVHVIECTQPQGHSTSGSHERYKSKERLAWEQEYCCIRKLRAWMIGNGIAKAPELDAIEKDAQKAAETARSQAWEDFLRPIRGERAALIGKLEALAASADGEAKAAVLAAQAELAGVITLSRRSVATAAFKALTATRGADSPARAALARYLEEYRKDQATRYSSHLLSESEQSPYGRPGIAPRYAESAETVDGRVVLLRAFDALFAKEPRLFALGEDVGKLGDVNLVFEGLNAKYGDLRVTDTGIREATILGQGIGAALRGLRPLVDIQYLDYLLYALQTASDDLATLTYRTAGGQKAPVVIRTKGHRLEGVWHTGSPMGMILHSLRGVAVCVPRDCTRAAGFYNLLLKGDAPALVIEVLNGYRLKERVPENLTEIITPLGLVETIRPGMDVTLVTYGACVRVAMEAAEVLSRMGIELEIIDAQTLLPFDEAANCAAALRRTHALVVLDEDVPGGASAYLLRAILEKQGGFDHLELPPVTLTAREHRGPYGSDGDYFSKPNAEDVVETVYTLMRRRNPTRFPALLV